MIISPLEFRGIHNVPALPSFSIESMGLGSLDDIAAPYSGEHFRKTFSGFVEGPTEATGVREHFLKIDAHDFKRKQVLGILEELGGVADAPILLGQFWYLLTTLGRRERFAAYVRKDAAVFTVSASWICMGRQTKIQSIWIESSDVNKPYSRGAGCNVLSR